MNTTQVRDFTYQSIIEELPLRRKTVLKLIRDYGGLTAQELREKMRIGVNQVSGRVTELADELLIVQAGIKINPVSRKPNTIWRVTTPSERERIAVQEISNLISIVDDLSLDYELVENSYSKELIISKMNYFRNKIEKLQAIL